MRVLITGGAGFVGASLAHAFTDQSPSTEVVVFDNLRRRGGELNLAAFKQRGIAFHHGDTRCPDDLRDLDGRFDLLIDASAEPSAHAGLAGSPAYVLQTNLGGTLNCLEFARTRCGAFVFLSTSRVYSTQPLRALPLVKDGQRFTLDDTQAQAGVSRHGIAEDFPTHLPRSYYGASKLASEQIIQEYADAAKLPAVINRCGVIAGPGQFGKVDQGVFTLWIAHHVLGKPLSYTGFGGEGRQVRDLLHPRDLFELLQKQLHRLDLCGPTVFNVGGGVDNAVSLAEYTALCTNAAGRNVPLSNDVKTSHVDVPWFVTDARRADTAFDWRPRTSVVEIVQEITDWMIRHRATLEPLYA